MSQQTKTNERAAGDAAVLQAQVKSKEDGLVQVRAELETALTDHELLRSELTGIRFQCEDLQQKLKSEREAAAAERAAVEKHKEAAAAAVAQATRMEGEKEEMAEELDALKVQMRAMMSDRRPSAFTGEDLEKCQVIFDHIRAENTKEAEDLLATGMPVDLTDSASFTPLMVACQFGQRRVVKALLRRGASLNLQNQHGDTALHCCMPDHAELAKYLISKGADEGVRNNNGKKWSEA